MSIDTVDDLHAAEEALPDAVKAEYCRPSCQAHGAPEDCDAGYLEDGDAACGCPCHSRADDEVRWDPPADPGALPFGMMGGGLDGMALTFDDGPDPDTLVTLFAHWSGWNVHLGKTDGYHADCQIHEVTHDGLTLAPIDTAPGSTPPETVRVPWAEIRSIHVY